jgi:outer membrane protein OmpA-like peptidoglycan-associated protein
MHRILEVAHTSSCALGLALFLASCSSPLKPPTVDDSTKRPVNARASVDLQTCRSDLSRTTILVEELARANAVSTAFVKNRSTETCPPESDGARLAATPSDERTGGNRVAIIEFATGSARWAIEKADADALAQRASSSALVMIRGRTDATGDSSSETALARRRAESAADFLRSRGVPADRIRVTWQGAGDTRSQSPQERAQDRRVELEFYAAPPATIVVRSDGRVNTL